MSTYLYSTSHNLFLHLTAILIIAILIQGQGYFFSTMEVTAQTQDPLRFLFGSSNSSSNCPPISIDEISAERPNRSIAKYYDTKRPAERAIDNDVNTKWTSKGNGSSLTLYLNSSSKICDLGIAWFLGSNRSYNFEVAISDNKSDFINVHSNRSSGTTNSTEIYHLPDENATALRLTVNGNNINSYAHVSEINLYGVPSDK